MNYSASIVSSFSARIRRCVNPKVWYPQISLTRLTLLSWICEKQIKMGGISDIGLLIFDGSDSFQRSFPSSSYLETVICHLSVTTVWTAVMTYLGSKKKVSPFIFNSGPPSTIIDTHLTSPFPNWPTLEVANVQTVGIADKSFPSSRGVAPEARCHVLVWLSGPSSELTGSVSFYEYIVMDISSRGQKEEAHWKLYSISREKKFCALTHVGKWWQAVDWYQWDKLSCVFLLSRYGERMKNHEGIATDALRPGVCL